MAKVDCWESKLFSMVEQLQDKPFRYGSHDCAKFSMKVIKEITDRDLLKETGTAWANRTKAAELIAQKSIIDRCDEHLTERPIKLLQRGDLVCKMTPEGIGLGIWLSPKAVFVGENGLIMVNRDQLIKAWEV